MWPTPPGKGHWLLCGICKVSLVSVFSQGRTVPITHLATPDPYGPYSVGKTWATAQENLDLKERDASDVNSQVVCENSHPEKLVLLM